MAIQKGTPYIQFFMVCFTTGIFLLGAMPAASAESESRIRAFDDGGILMIPAAAFSVSGFDPDGHEFWSAVGYYRGSDTGIGCIKAAVYLPRFARVTSVRATMYDNADPADAELFLSRLDRNTGTVLTMAELETTGASTSMVFPTDTSIVEPVVLFPEYSYYVATCLNSSNLRLYGVLIYYEAVLFSDGFESGDTGSWSFSSQ